VLPVRPSTLITFASLTATSMVAGYGGVGRDFM
jgi:hypothetical protein